MSLAGINSSAIIGDRVDRANSANPITLLNDFRRVGNARRTRVFVVVVYFVPMLHACRRTSSSGLWPKILVHN